MTILNTRFRQTETMLRSVLGTDVADCICAVLALADEYAIASSMMSITIPIARLADRIGYDRVKTLNSLRWADGCFHEAFGLPMAEAPDAYDVGHDLADLEIELSLPFSTIVRGTAIKKVDRDAAGTVNADPATQAWIELLCHAAETGSASAFLYRYADAMGEKSDELRRVCAALVHTGAPPREIFLFDKSFQNEDGCASPAGALLCAALHSDASILVGDANITALASNWADDEFSADYDSTKRPQGWSELTSDGERFLALLSNYPMVTLIAIPPDVRLRSKDAARFSGAFGPFRQDRGSVIQTLKAATVGQLSDANAESLASIYTDPQHAYALLGSARRIVDRTIDTDARRNQIDEKRKVRIRPDASPQAADVFNPVVTALSLGMSSHIYAPTRYRPKASAPMFFTELFFTAPDASLLWQNAEALRESGAKILLVGPPGTGKSAAAAAIAAAMQMESAEVRASDLLFYKLGAMEKAVSAAFRSARSQNNVLVFDECESIVQSRYTASSNATHLVTALTNQMLLECDSHHLPIIFASNFSERIDPALKRRVDLVFEVQAIPEALEGRAWELLLDTPQPGAAIGQTCISDYVQADRIRRLTSVRSLGSLAAAVRQARDIRLGVNDNKVKIGFI